jgi:hypothetical protein
MAYTWTQLKADLEANWDLVIPPELDDVTADGINNLAGAKSFIVMCVRLIQADVIKRGIARRLRQAKNTITNQISTAKSAYEADYPAFDGQWDRLSNTKMFTMLSPYYPTVEQDFNYTFGILPSKARDAQDKVDGLLEEIIAATEK